MKSKTLVIGGLLMALAVFFLGTSLRTRAGKSPGVTAPGTNEPRKAAPDFELKSLDGHSLKLSDFRGHVVLLNFWATYCAPCRVEMPWFVELYKQYHDQGLEIIGVSMDDDGEQQQIADFVREVKVNYPILLGNHTVGDAYGGTQLLPKTLFIDRKGNISSSIVGLKSKSELESAVKFLLAEGQ